MDLKAHVATVGIWSTDGISSDRPLTSLGTLYDLRKQKLRFLFIGMILLIFCWTKHPLENEITMVDIGQGDSIFYAIGKGRTILIDVGGRVTFKSGRQVARAQSICQRG